MLNESKNYFIKIKGELISVNEEIYKTYYRMYRHERYLNEKDFAQGFLYYDAGDNLGDRFLNTIADSASNTEEFVLKRMEAELLWECIAKLQDKYQICYFTALGYTEREISKIVGISQAAVHKQKKKIFEKAKKLLVIKKVYKNL